MANASKCREADEDNVLRSRLRTLPLFARELLAGGLAGGTAKSCVAPLERTKILYQTRGLSGQSVTSTLHGIWQSEGLPGLFRGNSASVLRIVPYAAIHFGLYENYRRVIVRLLADPSSAQDGRVNPVWDLLAGSCSGATAVIVTYPLDLVRTRLAYATEASSAAGTPHTAHTAHAARAATGAAASTASSAPAGVAAAAARTASTATSAAVASGRRRRAHHSIRSVLVRTVSQEGVRGLYHGVGPTLLGILPYSGLKFYVYQSLKRSYRDAHPAADGGKLPTPVMLLCGATAGLLAQTVTYPFDVVRRRMQVEGLEASILQPPGSSSSSTSVAAASTSGSSSSGGGAGPRAASRSPTGAVGATSAVQTARYRPETANASAAAGPQSAIISSSATHVPQTGVAAASRRLLHDRSLVPRRTALQTLIHIHRTAGLAGLFRGLSINYMKVVPSTAIGFTMYDRLKSYLDVHGNL